MAKLDKFDSFFSCAGWSQHGTASFTHRSLVVPVKAEEGLAYDRAFNSAGFKAIGGYRTGPDLKHQRKVDSEGRVLALDCGLFILLNVCVPSLRPLSLSFSLATPSSPLFSPSRDQTRAPSR